MNYTAIKTAFDARFRSIDAVFLGEIMDKMFALCEVVELKIDTRLSVDVSAITSFALTSNEVKEHSMLISLVYHEDGPDTEITDRDYYIAHDYDLVFKTLSEIMKTHTDRSAP